MDYSVLSNSELQRQIQKICKVYADRQDYKQAKASGAKERLYNVLFHNDDFPGDTHEERLKTLTKITEFEFLEYRNSGMACLARAIYELSEMGLEFKKETGNNTNA